MLFVLIMLAREEGVGVGAVGVWLRLLGAVVGIGLLLKALTDSSNP
jgi:hypothetical protein